MSTRQKISAEEALRFHQQHRPGKLAIQATKPLDSQYDLALAYSPGVAFPCQEIVKDPTKAYDYTAKGNMVAVISNGTAVLGLGNLGALASKPVMEGKSVLFKRFADIDGIDIEVDTEDTEAFINCVKYLGKSWGGINLEDIKAPECFIIEKRLREEMDIPVFHDDQHGTAIITLAGLINAVHLTDRSMKDIKVVVNGAGAAAIACIELIKAKGVAHENVILCDTAGTIYKGRTDRMNEWKEKHAVPTDARTLAEAMVGADVFLGLSVKDAVTKEMVASMAAKPIIFAMANPDPEIRPEDVMEVRNDAIIATGRSDYNNQVNNVMGFPYIFRGTLDVRARLINDEMKIAAADALAELAREHVPDEVSNAYSGRRMQYGPEYIIPVPFDPRLIYTIPVAVAQAAMKTDVADKPIEDIEAYRQQLKGRLDPTSNTMNMIFKRVTQNPKRIIFAEGEEENVIRAAYLWQENGYGKPVLVGRDHLVKAKMEKMGLDPSAVEIQNAAINKRVDTYIDFLYKRLQRMGFLYRDCNRLVKNDRNIFAACLLALGDGDALVSGTTRNYSTVLKTILKVIDQKPQSTLCGISLLVAKGRAYFIADSTVHEMPTAEELADIATQAAAKVRDMGFDPRVAMLSVSNFGSPVKTERLQRMQDAIRVLDSRKVDFEYDGEMSPAVALSPELMKLYPFCRLSGPANILVMPALNSAHISTHMVEELGGASVIGPILTGMSKPVQILQMDASVSEIINLAAIAAADAM